MWVFITAGSWGVDFSESHHEDRSPHKSTDLYSRFASTFTKSEGWKERVLWVSQDES